MNTISVITPSFNQDEFLAETLTSVITQSVKPVEHLVYDPGSTDNSREIARSFPHVTLIEEPDEGQGDAVNKGFLRAKGDIVAWLNSDDYYFDTNVFEKVISRFNENDSPDIIYGRGTYVNENGEWLRDCYINSNPDILFDRFQHEVGILQPAVFFKKEILDKVGLLDIDLHYCMDYEFWIRCVKAGYKFTFIDEKFVKARYHINNKTYGMRGNSYSEVCQMLQNHFGYTHYIWLKRYAEYLVDGMDGVLAHSGNTQISSDLELEKEYKNLLKAYNGNWLTFNKILEHKDKPGYRETLKELQNYEIEITPAREIDLKLDYEPGRKCYTVGSKRWSFEGNWYKRQIENAHEYLKRAIKEKSSDKCVIVGNGPSLKKIDFEDLKGHDVIISNNVFLSKELCEIAKYFTVVNYLVAEQSHIDINKLNNIEKIIPYWLSYCINQSPQTHFVTAIGYPEFSTDMFKNMSWRHTVTFFNLHLAYGLGYKKVILTGFDHYYKQESSIKEGEVIIQKSNDENHFHDNYFKGKKWQAADVDMMEAMYKLADEAYKADDREIINATVGGHLELFPRQKLKEALNG